MCKHFQVYLCQICYCLIGQSRPHGQAYSQCGRGHRPPKIMNTERGIIRAIFTHTHKKKEKIKEIYHNPHQSLELKSEKTPSHSTGWGQGSGCPSWCNIASTKFHNPRDVGCVFITLLPQVFNFFSSQTWRLRV